MRHGKRLIKTQSSVQIVAQRSFHNSRATNRLIAVAAIIVVILITATCSVFFNLQNFSTLQTLKSYGTTTEIIFSNPSTAQLTKLEESNLVQKPLYTSYRLGRLIGNPGQSGLSIDLWAVENWDTWSSPLVSNLQGHYPVEAGEVMLSTWLLERFEIEPVIGTEITFSVGWDDCDAVQEETFYLCGFYTDTSYIDTTSKQKVFLSAAVLAQHELPASIAGFSVSAGSGQRDLNQVINQLGLTEQQTVTVLSAGKMSLQDMVLALAVILFFYGRWLFNHFQHQLHFRYQGHSVLWPTEDHRNLPQAVKAGNLLPDGSDIADGSSRWVAPRLYYNAMDRAPAVGKFAGRFHSGKPPLGSTCCISPFFLRDDFCQLCHDGAEGSCRFAHGRAALHGGKH